MFVTIFLRFNRILICSEHKEVSSDNELLHRKTIRECMSRPDAIRFIKLQETVEVNAVNLHLNN